MTKDQLHQWYEWLLAFLIFLIPSNLFLKFWVEEAYVHGLLVDYLLPKVYVSDLVILAILGLWSWELFQTPKRGKNAWFKLRLWKTPGLGFAFLVGIFIVRQFLTEYPLASVWYLVKLGEMALLGLFLFHHQLLLHSKLLFWSLAVTLFFQATLGLYQFQTQQSLFSYYTLGETNLSQTLGLAKGVFQGAEKTLPYGTTAHPNILGGVLAIYLLLLTCASKLARIKASVFHGSLAALVLITLFLTQSVSAGVTLVIGLLVIQLNRRGWLALNPYLVIGGLLLVALSPLIIHQLAQQATHPSLSRRDFLNQAAVRSIIDRPLMGVGLNNFTASVERYGRSAEIVRFVQPVHHSGLLWLSETGILGLSLVAILGLKWRVHLKSVAGALLPFLPIFVLDHYLLTQQTGLLLGVIGIAILAVTQSRRGVSADRS